MENDWGRDVAMLFQTVARKSSISIGIGGSQRRVPPSIDKSWQLSGASSLLPESDRGQGPAMPLARALRPWACKEEVHTPATGSRKLLRRVAHGVPKDQGASQGEGWERNTQEMPVEQRQHENTPVEKCK